MLKYTKEHHFYVQGCSRRHV